MYYYTRQQTKIILAKKILCKEKDAKKNIGDKFPNNPKKKCQYQQFLNLKFFDKIAT